jgi:HEAT repeat protein
MEEGDNLALQALLAPLGDAAVDGLLDVLATETDGHARGILVNLLAELARGHTARLAARLSDRRWEVVRDAVSILNRAGGPDAGPALVEASRHAHPAVRKESIWGLIGVGPAGAERLRHLADDPDEGIRVLAVGALGGLTTPAAVTALVEVARRGNDQAIRRTALDHLARHPSAEARSALEGLAKSRSRPKLPRALRKHARALVRSGVRAAA